MSVRDDPNLIITEIELLRELEDIVRELKYTGLLNPGMHCQSDYFLLGRIHEILTELDILE